MAKESNQDRKWVRIEFYEFFQMRKVSQIGKTLRNFKRRLVVAFMCVLRGCC